MTRADGMAGGTPAWPEEEHVCGVCRLAYSHLSVADAIVMVRELPALVQATVATIPSAARTWRPGRGTWSVTEYLCHLRDVYATYTIRLHRARTEDEPAIEPMFNDLRARRFRYNERDADAVLDELAANVAGFCDEVALMQPEDWGRTVRRLPGETRTARWLLRQAAHEGRHHLHDIETLRTTGPGETATRHPGPAPSAPKGSCTEGGMPRDTRPRG